MSETEKVFWIVVLLAFCVGTIASFVFLVYMGKVGQLVGIMSLLCGVMAACVVMLAASLIDATH